MLFSVFSPEINHFKRHPSIKNNLSLITERSDSEHFGALFFVVAFFSLALCYII